MKIRLKIFVLIFLSIFVLLFSFDTYTVVYSYEDTNEQKSVTYRDYYFMPEVKILDTFSDDIRFETIDLNTIKIDYYDTLYYKNHINKNKIRVSGIFEDGKVLDITKISDIKINNNVIRCSLGNKFKKYNVPVIDIKSIEFITEKNIYENNKFPDGKIKIIYENNYTKTVNFSDNKILALGDNEFIYDDFAFNIKAEKEPWNHKILRENKSELENADNKYISNSLIILEKKYSYYNSDYVYISHIFTKNPEQIKVESANDVKYNGELESPYSLNNRKQPKLLVNGGGFNINSDCMPTRYNSSVYFLNNTHVNSVNISCGTELFINKNGELFSKNNATVEDLIQSGVHSSLTFKENPIIADGNKQDISPMGYAPRSGIGMVKPGEYYVIIAGHSNYSNGLTITQLRDIFYDLGCIYAFNLDGGGSSTLMINNKKINESAQSSVRSVVNYICFYE